MKIRIAALPLLALYLTLAVLPATAQTVYSNGPINGNVDAWTINFGFIVSDTFTLTTDTRITGLSFGAWLFAGDTLTSAEVSVTSLENGGTSYFDQMVNFTTSGCMGNQFGFNVCNVTSEMGSLVIPSLDPGTYWLNLQNASVPSGDPVYWDENSGVGCTSPGCPSSASENSVGSIPSEAFTLLGEATTQTSTTTSTTTSVPEPSSIMLFGSAILGLAGMVRRKQL